LFVLQHPEKILRVRVFPTQLAMNPNPNPKRGVEGISVDISLLTV